jgi:tryptophanyl-tRNA synthetase
MLGDGGRWQPALGREGSVLAVRVFSGIQPTGHLHLGNYLGAIRQFVALQGRAECLFCVVDLHALTVHPDPASLEADTLQVAALYLACGIDPRQAVVFVQSHVPGHAELAWILGCHAGFGELRRMTQFKDKADRHGANLGLFAYPVLMAADILLYRSTAVPVGDDQKQHLELTRDIAQRFNARYGETFPVPEPLIGELGARVMSLQNPAEKMSKSSPDPMSRIELLDPPDAIVAKCRRAVTDSGQEVRYDPVAKPGVSNLLEIFSLVTGEPIPALEARYGSSGYGRFKADLAEAIVEHLQPIQARYHDLAAAPDALRATLREGAARAAAWAEPVLAEVRARVGLAAR